MPEEKGKTPDINRREAGEERILKRIENGIKNDGVPEGLAEKYLYSEKLTIPALRFTMLTMLSSIKECYAGFFFDILSHIEGEIKGKRLPAGEAGDLSQSYFRVVKSLSDSKVPMEKLSAALKERETGEAGETLLSPCELSSLIWSLKNEERRKEKEKTDDWIQEAEKKEKAILQALDALGKSMEEKYGTLLEMAENILKASASLEASQDILAESIREAVSLSEEKERKFQVVLEEAAEREGHMEETLLQLEEKTERLYGMLSGIQENVREKEPSPHLSRALSKILPAISLRMKKGKTGRREKEELSLPGDEKRDVRELIYLLKKHNCPGEVRDAVVSALKEGVPLKEVLLAVEDSYKEGGEGDGMLKDVLDIMLLCRKETGKNQEEE